MKLQMSNFLPSCVHSKQSWSDIPAIEYITAQFLLLLSFQVWSLHLLSDKKRSREWVEIMKQNNFADQVYLKKPKSSAYKLHKLTSHKYQLTTQQDYNQTILSERRGNISWITKKKKGTQIWQTKVTFQLSNLLIDGVKQRENTIPLRTNSSKRSQKDRHSIFAWVCKQPLKHHPTQLCGTCRYFPTWTIWTGKTWGNLLVYSVAFCPASTNNSINLSQE